MSLASLMRNRIINEATADLKEDDFKAPIEPDKGLDAPADDTGEDIDPIEPAPVEDEPATEEEPATDDNVGEDDFSMDDNNTDEDEEDPTPEEDGEAVVAENDGDNPDNTVNKTILNISQVDRAIAEKKMLNDYFNLRSLIMALREKMDIIRVNKEENEVDYISKQMDVIDRNIDDYIKYKIGINSLEENSRNFVLLSMKLNEIMDLFKLEPTDK